MEKELNVMEFLRNYQIFLIKWNVSFSIEKPIEPRPFRDTPLATPPKEDYLLLMPHLFIWGHPYIA